MSADTALATQTVPAQRDSSRVRLVVRRLLGSPLALTSFAVLAVALLIAVFAAALAPYAPEQTDFAHTLSPPGTPGHLLGSDDLGRDVLSRIVYGMRASLEVGALSVFTALVIGVPLGLVAGYFRAADAVISRFTDLLLAFPFLILAVGLAAIRGASLANAAVAIGIAQIPGVIRIVRSDTLRLKSLDFVAAAVVDGASDLSILTRHVLPNAISVILVQGTVAIPAAILGEAVLSFLGLGIQPPDPSLGTMLANAQQFAVRAPWAAVLPGIAIMLLALAFNVFGDSLRDALDPESEPPVTLTIDPPGVGAQATGPVLEVQGLTVTFRTESGTVSAVDDVDLTLGRGEIVGVVGESGCGKSVTAMSLAGLLPRSAAVSGSVRLLGQELVGASPGALRQVRGQKIAYIFQEPMTSLNPVLTVGRQIAEVLQTHRNLSRKAALDRAVELLQLVGIPSPRERVGQYPHQLSGGMRQRVMIAMAVAGDPEVLVADEPTTALDVTVQAGILTVLRELRDRLGTSILIITHDLGVIADVADRVVVMYAGRVVERAPVDELFARPRHHYTSGLLAAAPTAGRHAGTHRLQEIPGLVPVLSAQPDACTFADRCPAAQADCRERRPPLSELGAATLAAPGSTRLPAAAAHLVACWHPHRDDVSGGHR